FRIDQRCDSASFATVVVTDDVGKCFLHFMRHIQKNVAKKICVFFLLYNELVKRKQRCKQVTLMCFKHRCKRLLQMLSNRVQKKKISIFFVCEILIKTAARNSR